MRGPNKQTLNKIKENHRKILLVFRKLTTTNVSNQDHDYNVDVLFFNDNDNNV